MVTSALTSAEIARTLHRLVASAEIDSRTQGSAWTRYSAVIGHWHVYRVDESVLARASQPYPREPVRTLDAIHLATAALFSRAVSPADMLSADERIRANAVMLGMTVIPPG